MQRWRDLCWDAAGSWSENWPRPTTMHPGRYTRWEVRRINKRLFSFIITYVVAARLRWSKRWRLSISRYDLVQLLLSYGAEVNCYFRVISNTVFPTALQYSLRDHVMLRLLLNSGYQAHKYVRHLWSEGALTYLTDSSTEKSFIKLHIWRFHPRNTVSGRCFQCCHGNVDEMDSTWTDLHNQAYQIYTQPNVITVRANSGIICCRFHSRGIQSGSVHMQR